MSCRDCFDIFDGKRTFVPFSQILSCDLGWSPFDLDLFVAPFNFVHLQRF